METEIKIFGIRHHGAGSAKRLYSALNKFKPDEICIEMPFESLELITQLKVTPHICPLAFLYYNKENSKQSMYYPFAEFSPEYQAIKYSFEQNIPIIPIDLPAGMSLIPSNFKKETEVGLNSDQQHMINDPLGYLARQSGYKDTERWWDSYFESWTEDEELFNIIHNLMLELRTNSKGIDDYETLLREEFMRQQINICINKSPEKLAIVCGAWHSPALSTYAILPSKKVNLDSLKNLSIGSSIIPWTYSRLALNRYYSAGIESPVWHECIFQNSETAISNWLSQAATQFRKNGYQVSTAEHIDTERLSKELAMLREMPIAGIEELMDACTTVIGKGDVNRINLLKNQMIIGNKSGEIEVNSETLSLIKEFKTKLNLLRLTKHWSESGSDFLELDLRKEKHLAISRFLHQSILLKLDWCQPQELEIKAQGNFHENWKFDWNPDQEMTLIQAAIHASTIEDAIYYYVLDLL
ncbi:MAG: DUF5682 family protein, partial [Saprospiraceae bacterium]